MLGHKLLYPHKLSSTVMLEVVVKEETLLKYTNLLIIMVFLKNLVITMKLKILPILLVLLFNNVIIALDPHLLK